jgi:hypothetical protein
MKVAVALFLLAPPAFAQNVPASSEVPPWCGAKQAKFDVKTDKGQHPAVHPSEGKALVYFVEDDTEFGSFPKPTTRAGLDGKWVGATHGNSYIYFSVDPGERHLCASWQAAVVVRQGLKTGRATSGWLVSVWSPWIAMRDCCWSTDFRSAFFIPRSDGCSQTIGKSSWSRPVRFSHSVQCFVDGGRTDGFSR